VAFLFIESAAGIRQSIQFFGASTMTNPISIPLFGGNLVRLTPLDHEKDPEVVAGWTHNAEYVRMISLEPVRPLTTAQIKKQFEQIDKEMDEGRRLFHYAIRPRDDDRLIGEARIEWVEWSNGTAQIKIGLPDPADRRKGIGSDVLRLLLRFAFRELNMYHLEVQLSEYNVPALRFFEKHGFKMEVRRRQAVNRGGRRWDLISMAILRPEWEARNER
jgi:RimJ/RimL family protein N-acetyltransferase